MMRSVKNILLLTAVVCASALFGAGVAVEIDVRNQKIQLSEPAGLSFRHQANNDPARVYYWEFYSKEEASPDWKPYEISFVPEKDGYAVLGLTATESRQRGKCEWIDYDKLELVNSAVANPSFEQMSVKKDFYRWRYYTKAAEMLGKSDAPDGKNYVRVCRALCIRQGIRLTAGKKVTIKFLARNGGVSDPPKDKSYSDTSAPLLESGKKPVKSAPAGVPGLRLALRGEPFFNVELKELSSSDNLTFDNVMVKGKTSYFHACAYNREPLDGKWRKYTVTFTPSITGEINMFAEAHPTLRGDKVQWVFFDKFEAKGTKILNPSFETVLAGMPARWESYPQNVRLNVSDAPDGKNVAAVGGGSNIRQVISVVQGRPVTISFYARLGDVAKKTLRNKGNDPVPNKFPKDYYRFDNGIVRYLPLKNKGVPGSTIHRAQYSWIELTPPPPLTIKYPVDQKKGKLKKTAIPFELLEESNIARTVFVKFGFPFPEGGIYGIDKLRIVSPDGKAVPAQFTATSFWPDKSVKFVLAEFPAKLAAKEKSVWKLEINSDRKVPALPELKCALTDTGFAVDTGKLAATVSKSRFSFLNDVKVDGKKAGSFSPKGLEFVDEAGKLFTSSQEPLEKLYIESSGPLALTLRADGKLGGSRFTARMTFRAGSSVVDISIRFQNVDLKTEFNDFRSLSLDYVPAVPAKSIKMEGATCQRIHQQDDETLKIDDRLFNRKMGDGGAAGNLTYALRDAAYRYPKAFSVDKGAVKFELLPPLPGPEFGKDMPYYLQYPFCGGFYRMKWGMGFTEDLKIDFSGKTSPAELAAKSVIPVIDRDWVYKTKVFQGIPHGGENPFAGIDAECLKAFYRHMEFKAKQREYGFLNWGDWFGERGRNWTNNEYDLAHGMFMLYLRTGNRDVFRWAMTAARHQADVDIIHAYPDPMYVGANAQHGIGHTGQTHRTPSQWSNAFNGAYIGRNGHTWSEGMTEAWLLGGDEISMESALLLGEHLVNFIAPTQVRLSTHERSAGWSIPALLGLYRATGDRKYLAAARLLVDVVLDEQKFDLGGAWPHRLPGDHANGRKFTYGNCPYLVGIVCSALQRYYREDPDPAVKKSLVAAAGWLHRSLDKNRVGWSYGTGWDGEHYWLPSQGLNLLIVPGMMAGGQLADSKAIYESSQLVLTCAMMTGLSHVGKELSLRTCVLPLLYEEMNIYRARHPEAGRYDELAKKIIDRLNGGVNDRYRMRGPDNMAFEVLAYRPTEITILRNPTGSNPKTKPQFKCAVTDKAGKVLASFSGKIRENGEWKVKLPAKGTYKVEIEDSCTGVWDVLSKDCRIRTELRPGYMFVNGGISRQFLVIPGGTKRFTLKFFGTHEGRCSAFLFDPRGRLVGNAAVMTSGKPRLPWFEGAETLPAAKIDVKVDKPSKRETLWKLVIYTGGHVRLDLIGTKGWVALPKNRKNDPGI